MSAETRSPGRAFVTGGSGHVGANLVRRLLDDGFEVRALAHPEHNNRGLEGLDLEVVEGDVRDAAAMTRLIKGCKYVFHVAAKVSTVNATPAQEKEIFDINVLGTRNVMRAALEAGVERAVLTGSLSAVGYDPQDPHKPSTEDMPHYPFDTILPYARSKTLAEHEVLKAVVDGLDAVIATSCGVIGPHDYVPSRLGRVMCDYCNGKLRGYIPGGFEFVSTDDLIEGHMLAFHRGRTGHKYIFASSFHTLDELFDMYEKVSGQPRPKLRLPPALMSTITSAYYGIATRFFPDVPQRLTPAAIKLLTMRRRADTSKAQTELGFQPTPMSGPIERQYRFFVDQGMIRSS